MNDKYSLQRQKKSIYACTTITSDSCCHRRWWHRRLRSSKTIAATVFVQAWSQYIHTCQILHVLVDDLIMPASVECWEACHRLDEDHGNAWMTCRWRIQPRRYWNKSFQWTCIWWRNLKQQLHSQSKPKISMTYAWRLHKMHWTLVWWASCLTKYLKDNQISKTIWTRSFYLKFICQLTTSLCFICLCFWNYESFSSGCLKTNHTAYFGPVTPFQCCSCLKTHWYNCTLTPLVLMFWMQKLSCAFL